MDRLALKEAVNRILEQEVNLQARERRTSKLTIEIDFREGGIRQVKSTVQQVLVENGH